MSTEKLNEKTVEEKKNDQVKEVTEKLDELNVDKDHEANDEKANRRPLRGGRGYRGRGRGGRGGKFLPRIPYEERVKKIEEDQKSKKVLETGVEGHVKWYNVRGRYGFVARKNSTNEKDDFFVHQTAIVKSSTVKIYLRTLEDNEPILFDIVEGRKGPEAANVSGPNGENVVGSRFAKQLLFRFNQNFRHGPPRRRQNTNEKRDGEKQEENTDGEVRGQRRPRRARGKLTRKENGEKNENVENGSGDSAAPVPAPEKEVKNRRNRNKGTKVNNNNNKGEEAENKQVIEA